MLTIMLALLGPAVYRIGLCLSFVQVLSVERRNVIGELRRLQG
jgi:hypothetical protein